MKLLETEKQTLWAVLRSSLCQQLDYWLQLCYPSDVLAAAERMDNILWQALQVATGSRIPRVGEGSDWECIPSVPVESLRDRSFQEWVVRQPIRFGGLGVRGQRETVPAAFIGALEQTLPAFTGDRGVCQQLTHLVAEPGDEENRWQALLQSGCRTGTELAWCWESLTTEAREMGTFLNQEVEKIFLVPVQGVGEGRTDGKTRSVIIETREKTRGQALTRALELHPDRQVRPVLMWPQLDKCWHYLVHSQV